MTASPTPALVAECCPTGALRVGLNMANFLLINGKRANGEPDGIAPDIGREIARRFGVAPVLVPYAQPGDLAAAAGRNEWDVGLIGADPLRAAEIAFTDAYLEIEASYLVASGSPLASLDQVDRPGVRIAVADKSAYDMYLRRTLKHAELVRAEGLDGSYHLWVEKKLDALAGLKPRLTADQAKHPGSRILPGRFTAVQQAIGVPIARQATAAWMREFVAEIRQGLVAELIARHRVVGVSVAGAA